MFSNNKINVQQCLEQIQQHLSNHELFYGHGTDNAYDEACWLLETVLKRHDINEIALDSSLNQSQLNEINAILSRRVQEKKPLAYLLNEAWFATYPFYVDERVLVPRSPIAELIGNGFEPLLPKPPERILDLCSGSGCIGIACALAFPDASVVLADLSTDALAVAAINIEKHQLSKRVTTLHSDLFDDVEGCFDLIVSNPPYVSKAEYESLPEEYLQEPEMGLVSQDNGLALPGKILNDAARCLTADGVLVLEVGYSWQALVEVFSEYPFLWLDFEFGGEGVCLLTQSQLQEGNTSRSKTFKAI